MPRQQTYGKRTRVVYSAVTLSSPDPSSTKHAKSDEIKNAPIKVIASRKRTDTVKGEKRSERKVLGERSENAVVEPVEPVYHGKTQSKIRDVTTVDKDTENGRANTSTKLVFNDEDESYHAITSGSDATEIMEQAWKGTGPIPRRSPRKIKEGTSPRNNAGKPSQQCNPRSARSNPLVQRKASYDEHGEEAQEEIATERKRERSRRKAHDRVTPSREGSIVSDQHRERLRGYHRTPQSALETPRASNPYEKHCEALLDLSQHPLTCFHGWSSQLSEHFNVTKIAEASFGEVYRLSLREAIPDFSRADESVFKIIPLKPFESILPRDGRKKAAALKKTEFMSMPGDVANEVKLLQRMSAVPGFTNFRDVRILQGRPPEAFISAFKAWNVIQRSKKKELSHFPDPARKSSYAEDQLWAVIEMQDAGTDLERLVEDGLCTSIWSVWDTFWQVVLSLAKGEESAEFEHRDLHLGNICVRLPSSNTASQEIDTKRKLDFTSLETTIIDYTISRCTMPGSTTAYTDLSLDPALFEGDSTDEYQYDIYRYMRSVLFLDEALADFHSRAEDVQASERTWEQYHPQTNLVWLHLVLYKLLEQVVWPSGTKAPNRKTKREEYTRWKRANDLEHVLLKVQELLDPGTICGSSIQSVGDLILFALQEAWLDVQDVVGHGEGDESALVSQLEGLEL